MKKTDMMKRSARQTATIADNPPRNLLLDDEVGALLDALKTDNIIVVLDSCYSGTATKALDIGQIRRKVRFMQPPSGDDFANPRHLFKDCAVRWEKGTSADSHSLLRLLPDRTGTGKHHYQR